MYIFEINSLSVASFAIIFYSEGCLFTLLIVSFVVQKLLSLIRSHCLFLLLFPIFWEVGHRGSCCDVCLDANQLATLPESLAECDSLETISVVENPMEGGIPRVLLDKKGLSIDQ